MSSEPAFTVLFFRTETGREPVREWLKALSPEERRMIGEDLKTLQFRWPLGLPLVRSLGSGLWEVRSRLPNRIARTLFYVRTYPKTSRGGAGSWRGSWPGARRERCLCAS